MHKYGLDRVSVWNTCLWNMCHLYDFGRMYRGRNKRLWKRLAAKLDWINRPSEKEYTMLTDEQIRNMHSMAVMTIGPWGDDMQLLISDWRILTAQVNSRGDTIEELKRDLERMTLAYQAEHDLHISNVDGLTADYHELGELYTATKAERDALAAQLAAARGALVYVCENKVDYGVYEFDIQFASKEQRAAIDAALSGRGEQA